MLIRVKKVFQKALFPSECHSCGHLFHAENDFETQAPAPEYFRQTPLESVFQREMSTFLCPECIEQFSPVTPPFCAQCGRMFKSIEADNHRCEDCIRKGKHYHTARSAGLLNGAFMKTIHKFKYDGKIQLARPLERLLFAAFIKYFEKVSIDLIIPVPLHISRLKHRGFNQAMLILGKWPDLIGRMNKTDIHVDLQGDILNRKKKTKSQTGLGKQKRRSNIRGAFAATNPLKIKDKRILLVDDVFTTGATTEECAKILKSRGAGEVHILTLARTESY